MGLNILAVTGESGHGDFSATLDLSHIHQRRERPFPSPVKVSGTLARLGESRPAENILVSLTYTAQYTVQGTCARCLCDVQKASEGAFAHIAAGVLPEDAPEDWVEAPDGLLDLNSLVGSDLLLNLEIALLCREDCQGLCPECGANRNETDCGCDRRKKTDPRFEALLEFLDD